MKKIIDCHAHIYPKKIAKRATENVGNFYNMTMKYDGVKETLANQCKLNNISKCLICSVATAPKQVRSVNIFIAESVKENNGLFFGFCTLHPDMSREELREELKYAKFLGLKGIKLHPDFQEFKIDGVKAYKIYEEVGGDFVFLFHMGDNRYNFSEPFRLANAMRDFPDMIAIGAHFGGWSDWDNALTALAGLKNLYVDTCSSFYALTPAKAVNLIKAFGAGKVLFGSDFPMWDVGAEIEFLNRLDISDITDQEKEMIFYKNAEKLFGF